MTVYFPGQDENEAEPTERLVIKRAQIEPWASELIKRSKPVYTFSLELSRVPTKAEQIILELEKGKEEAHHFDLGFNVYASTIDFVGDHLLVGEFSAEDLVKVARNLDNLVRDVERRAREAKVTARREWEEARAELSSLTWSDGGVRP